jgi:HSP20 family protein
MRSFELPFEADTDKVEASFDKGVLKISVPRSTAPEKQVKKITIKSS